MEVCKECACNCKPVNYNCIADRTDMDRDSIQENHISNANDDISDLIGVDCADQLCEALKAAVEQVEDNRGTIDDYLDSKWVNVINNSHFIAWYAYRVQYHFLLGTSISNIESSRLIVEANDDDVYKNSFTIASPEERKRLQEITQFYIKKYQSKFLETYWYKNTDKYDCAVKECGCCKDYTCNDHKKKKRGIGIRIVNSRHDNRW